MAGFRELFAYDRGITMQEGQVRYTVAAREAARLRGKKVRRGEVDHRSFDVRGIPLHVEIPDEVYGRYLKPR